MAVRKPEAPTCRGKIRAFLFKLTIPLRRFFGWRTKGVDSLEDVVLWSRPDSP